MIHFDEKDWLRIQNSWNAWWEGEIDRPMVVIEVQGSRVSSEGARKFAATYPIDMPAEEVIDIYEKDLEARRWYGDAWPRWFPNFGPGMMAGFMGARVNPVEETVWFEPPETNELRGIRPIIDWENPWWRRVEELTQCAVGRWAGQVCVGFTDIGGNLDVLASLRGSESLLLDIVDEPGRVKRLSKKLTRLWLEYYRRLNGIVRETGRGTTPWAHIWAPGPSYMLQSDISCMLSPQIFERLVLPDLETCCRAIEYSFYHLDGPGALRHLDELLSIKKLRGIQWVPGDGAPPPEKWLSLLSQIRSAGKLCQLYVSPQGARTIVSELGGRGFALAIRDVRDQGEAEGLLHELGL
jgi:5-methyltetrahydrofolate--homocysteine methyltransferase